MTVGRTNLSDPRDQPGVNFDEGGSLPGFNMLVFKVLHAYHGGFSSLLKLS